MATSSQSSKILSLKQISMLPHEELVSQLHQAQKKIQELEAISNDHIVHINSTKDENVSHLPADDESRSESIFGYSADNSVDSMFDNVHPDPEHIMDALEWKLKNGSISNHRAFQQYDNRDFVVAYECKGEFPSCDEDLSTSSQSLEGNEGSRTHPKIIIHNDGIWDNENDDDDDGGNIDQLESFELIPSPVLNTPPYEYIFLTKTNEAKCRIFLNQKLNKVFQEEIHKLQKREEELLKGKSQYLFDEPSDNDENQDGSKQRKHSAQIDHSMDLHNQNHLVISPSENGINSGLSTSNVIHCFDPSDVDLELKKIFMEKPPVTHKIVRRKSRRERGSSVPAVDSYYGTGDLSKVGHASWFIPTLTESERKAIGWKHEYHYGHWKYAALNVPSVKVNQISLHPHKELDDTIQSKHNNNHSHYQSGTLHHNPLHHHEIDLSEHFDTESQDGSLLSSQQQQSTSNKHEVVTNEDDDTLSFITLSGCSTEMTQSCHIIPDKSTLRRILRFILPCIKSNASTVATSADHNGENSSGDYIKVNGKTSNVKKHHEIETLVEPPEKFPISHTYISLESSIDEEVGVLANDFERNKERQPENKMEENKESQSQSKHNHHSHHHQHGIFHWKKILSSYHDDSVESMSVVGGDVIASIHEFNGNSNCRFENGVNNASGIKKQDCVFSLHLETGGGGSVNDATTTYYASSTESEDSEDNFSKYCTNAKRKGFRKLKPCKAFTKLLTLKDLGYETDEMDDKVQESRPLKINNNRLGSKDLTLSQKNVNDECALSKKRESKKVNNGNNEEVPTTNTSTTGVKSPRESSYLSPDSSGFPFSSLSISYQNSEIEPNFEIQGENFIPSCSDSQTEQQINGIETRFLDPKDLLKPPLRTGQNEPVDEDSLPFVFDFNSSQQDTNVNFMEDYGEQHDDNVIEWMGGDFVDEIEEGLGLLSSCLDTLLKYNKSEGNENGNLTLNASIGAENEGAPEKVAAQHRITTLKDLDGQCDAINRND